MFNRSLSPSTLRIPALLLLISLFLVGSLAQPARSAETSIPSPLYWTRRAVYAPHDFLPTTAALKLDSYDQPHLAYGGEQLYYAALTETSWQVEVVDPALKSGTQAVLALDSNDQPHILYRETVSDTVKYAHRSGGEWLIQPVAIGADQPEDYSFTLTSDDRPCLSYYESVQEALKYACWDGSAWQAQVVEAYLEQEAAAPDMPPPPPQRRFLSSLALDQANAPHLAIMDMFNASLQYAEWISDSWAIESITTTLMYSARETPALALDSTGSPYIGFTFWYEPALWYAYLVNGNWQVDLVDPSTEYNDIRSIVIDLDSTEQPHLSYVESGEAWSLPNSVKLASLIAGEWVIQDIESGGIPSLAIDSQNVPHLSFMERIAGGGYDLRYVRWQGDPGAIQSVDSAARVWDTLLGLDQAGNAHIVYKVQKNTLSFDDALSYAYIYWDGASWQVGADLIINAEIDTLEDASMALDAVGNPHLAFVANYSWLLYAGYDGQEWHPQTIDGNVFISRPSIALDGAGIPHVAYTGDRGGWNLFYATLTGGVWYTETVVSAPLESGTASLAIDSQDNPVICYSDLNLNTLNLATWTGTGWSFQIVDDSPWSKYGCDLKLDAADQPHLAFIEIVTNIYGESYRFRYAHRDGGEWLIEPLGDQPFYAWPPKLALDSTGSPIIGYFDDKDQVTLMHKAGGVWQEEYPPYPYCLDSLALDRYDLPWMTCTDQLNDLVLIRSHTQVNYLPVVGRDSP